MIKITNNKQIPKMKLTDVADITQVNKSLEKIDEVFGQVDTSINQVEQSITTQEQQTTQQIQQITQQIQQNTQQTTQQIQQVESKIDTHKDLKVNTELGVHGIRFFDNKLQVSTNTGWEEVGGGGGSIPPKNVTNINIKQGDSRLIISWSDPPDIIYDGATLSEWEKTKVVYKTGGYPQNPNDGTVATINTVRDKYKTNGYRLEGLTNGTTYYISFFPYSTSGIVNTNTANRIEGIPTRIPPNPVTNVSVQVKNTQLIVKWTDPVNKTGATWVKTKVVYKTGSFPTNDTDGTVAIENTVRDQYKTNGLPITNLTNNVTYYFKFFAFADEGGINDTVTTTGTPLPYRTYTVNINYSIADPEQCCTYADDAVGMTPGSDEWDEFFGIFPCLFKDGQVVKRLSKDNRTKFEDGSSADTTSGNSGDVMIAFPRRKWKIVTTGDIVSVSITDDLTKEDGFVDFSHRRGDVIKDYFYIGALEGLVKSGKLRSISPWETPTVNISCEDGRRYAQANGSGYDQLLFYPYTYIQICYILKYKNLNSQSAVGVGFANAIYLPPGQPGVISPGMLGHLGYTLSGPMDSGNKNPDSSDRMSLFGIENLWGNTNTWIDGMITGRNYEILTTKNINMNSTGRDYENQGTLNSLSGYFKKIYGTSGGGFLPKEGGASTTTYFCDATSISSYLTPSLYGNYTLDQRNKLSMGIFSINVNNFGNVGNSTTTSRLMYL